MLKELVGACGLYCGACPNYFAFTNEGSYLLLEDERFFENEVEKKICKGCHSEKRSEHCENCKLRICSEDKGILTSVDCMQYPCIDFMDFYSGAKRWKGARHRNDVVKNLKQFGEIGVEEWLKSQEKRWTCECGQKFSYYEEKCISCGKKLNSYHE